MTVVDVGANIGVYTRFLARLVGPDGHVYAFEPAPANYARLQASTNRLGNVTALPVALGEGNGTVALFLSQDLNVDHRTYDSRDGRVRLDVPLVQLDDYFPAGAKIDFMKIDVQGHEYSVLRGAVRVLKENPSITIMMEFWPFGLVQAGVDPKALVGFVTSMGFDIKRVGNASESASSLEDMATTREDQYCNVWITRPR
jgi:FkbM family methyltransferase